MKKIKFKIIIVDPGMPATVMNANNYFAAGWGPREIVSAGGQAIILLEKEEEND